MKKYDVPRRSNAVRLVLFAAMLACADEKGAPTAVAHPHDATPLANVEGTTAPDPLRCTGYPEPRIWLESQAWWNKAGISIPGGVGEHIHVGLCWPVAADGGEHLVTTDNQKMHFDVRVLTHNTQVVTQLVRVSQEGTVKIRPNLNIGPGNAEAWVPFDIDFSTWSTGRRELRWTSRIPRPDPTNSSVNEMFNSTGWQLCIRSCSPTYRPVGPFTEGRGYYSGHDYDNAIFLSKLPVEPVSGLWTFDARLVSTGPGGIFIDPDFHNGNSGTVVRGTGGSWKGTVTIDTQTLSNGPHRLVLVSSDGKNGGVQVIAFTVAN
jgi:hypothetical protein